MGHVELDVGEGEGGVEFAEVRVGEIVEDKAGGAEVGALDDVPQLDNVGVVELAQEMVLPPDLVLADGQQHLDGDALVSALVGALEDVGVLAPADFTMHHVVIHLPELGSAYPHFTWTVSYISWLGSRLGFTFA